MKTALWHILSTVRKINTHFRHHELFNASANLLSDVCHGVGIGPHLQLLRGENFAPKSTTTDIDARLERSGLSTRREHYENFHCGSCETETTRISAEATTLCNATADSQTSQSFRDAYPKPCSYWLNFSEDKAKSYEQHLQASIYKQFVQGNTNFCTLRRNRTGHMFNDTMNEILVVTLSDANAETAMYWAMMAPHP